MCHTQTICPTCYLTWNNTTEMNMPSFERQTRQTQLQKSHSSPRSLTVLLPLHIWERVPFDTSSYTVFALPLETVPARYQHLLGTISSGSVHMTKACQHCAKPSHAVLAQFTSIKWAKSVLHPCHAKHWTSVYQNQKRVTVISRLCSCIPCFFCYRWYGKGGNCLLQTSCLLSCHQMGATLLSCSVLASG